MRKTVIAANNMMSIKAMIARTEPSGKPSAWSRLTSRKMPNAMTTSEIEPSNATTARTISSGSLTSDGSGASAQPPAATNKSVATKTVIVT
jgi:hypothetical protein